MKATHPKGHQGYLVTLKIALISIVVIHFFGIIGLSISYTRPYFESATPINLIISTLLLFSFHKDWNIQFILFGLITFTVGYLIEVAGVHTGVIFGSYAYGPALGFKLWDVPLIIGINWLLLIYTTGVISKDLTKYSLVNSAIASLLMVFLDFFIEPIAVELNFWKWEGDIIPIQNFIGWVITAFFLQIIFSFLVFNKHNLFAKYVFIVQLVFFITLQILI